ncbi:MAG: pyridoxamine 5'-phosphate oxidase family protein [Saprospiraceae bacterium]|nr:pyridoxamine 5'-phosphate oxidase family protein [Saprospiraceae bacterium]
MLTPEIKHYIDHCVLCWLATCNAALVPNVSPKEVFTYAGDHTLLIADIASAGSVRNVEQNPNVCVSFVEVFIQKGFKLIGKARVLRPGDADFAPSLERLLPLVSEEFPIRSIFSIDVQRTERILAPSYFLFPDTTEEQQIESALKLYHVERKV